MSRKSDDAVLKKAEIIQRKRCKAEERRRETLLLRFNGRLAVREQYAKPVEPKRCGQYWSCCYAQGRCTRAVGHRGPHFQKECFGPEIAYIKYGEWKHLFDASMLLEEYKKRKKTRRKT